MARRAWVIDQIEQRFPKTPLFIADSGNFTDNPTPDGELRTAALLEGMARLGYKVVNVGERDVKSGYAAFARRTAKSELPFVSANIVRESDKRPVFEPHLVIDAASADGSAKLQVGVVGIARYNPIFRKDGPDGSEMVIVHPLEPVKEQVAALRRKGVELIVLLAAVHRDDASRIVREVPEIDFVIGSYGGFFNIFQEAADQAWIAYSGNQGKRLGSTRIYLDDGRITTQETRLHFMTKIYPSDPEMLEFVGTVPSKAESALPKVSSSSSPAGGPYVGAGACRDCHADQLVDWSGSAHAGAMKTLAAENKRDEAGCVKCHATGVGAPGGFVDDATTPLLANVGCESCHGPARGHLADTRRPYGEVTVASCTACHDRENSPEFDYYRYLPRVNHSPPQAAR